MPTPGTGESVAQGLGLTSRRAGRVRELCGGGVDLAARRVQSRAESIGPPSLPDVGPMEHCHPLDLVDGGAGDALQLGGDHVQALGIHRSMKLHEMPHGKGRSSILQIASRSTRIPARRGPADGQGRGPNGPPAKRAGVGGTSRQTRQRRSLTSDARRFAISVHERGEWAGTVHL